MQVAGAVRFWNILEHRAHSKDHRVVQHLGIGVDQQHSIRCDFCEDAIERLAMMSQRGGHEVKIVVRHQPMKPFETSVSGFAVDKNGWNLCVSKRAQKGQSGDILRANVYDDGYLGNRLSRSKIPQT